MKPRASALTRNDLIVRLWAMPPNARGRGELERLLVSMTNIELSPSSGTVPSWFKPRIRVKAGRKVQ